MSGLAKKPESSIPEALDGWAETKAAYRFFANDEIAPRSIIDAHAASTAKRAAEFPLVLAVQDTTIFNFSTHEAMKGRGPTGRGALESYGFFTHSCIALTPEGVPLGLLSQESHVRPDIPPMKSDHERERTPNAEKKTQRWLDVIEQTRKLVPSPTRILAVADREADIFDFFECAIANNQDFLVRSSIAHRATEEGPAWETIEKTPVMGEITVEIPRSADRSARKATLTVRFATVHVKPPRKRSGDSHALNMIQVQDKHDPGPGETRVDWRLYTSLPVTNVEQARQCVSWYALRWRIERYHYVLKSGCKIEELQLETVERTQRALAAYSVVASFLLSLTYQARSTPDAPCTTFLTSREWKTLHCLAHKVRQPPAKPPSLREATRMVGKLGGFLGRKGDGEPGVKVLWRGYRRLSDGVETLETVGWPGLVGNA